MKTGTFLEVIKIEKHRFLAELGKLLTFMYEEDRQTALSMYEKMFADAEDEQALLQKLLSPTRQAVVVAHAYDAKERKLQVHSQFRDEDDADREALPGFVLAINKIYEEAVPAVKTAAPPVLEDQVSLFDAAPTEPVPTAAAPVVEETVSALAAAVQAAENPDPLQTAMDADWNAVAAKPEQALAEEAEEIADTVDSFLEDFHIDEGLAGESEKAEAGEGEAEEDELDYEAPAVRAQPRVLLLILFWILGVPLILLGILILLIPTLISLGLAVSFIAAGSASVIGAFSGFAVFADILLVLGIALILLALGLLFLWLFVWFIGGAMVGLVKGIAALSRKWCYEEVAA